MSKYYGTTQGQRGQATRCGHSSITATANSWSIGGELEVAWSNELQTDVLKVYQTKGSNTSRSLIAAFADINGTRTVLNTNYPELFI